MAFCKANGWTVQIVEKWNQWAHVRQDLFGCLDLVVLDGAGGGPLGVQVTSASHVAHRMAKALAEPRLAAWLASPARFEVWGYGKRKKRKKDGSYGKSYELVLRREPILPGQLPTADAVDAADADTAQPRIDPAIWDA